MKIFYFTAAAAIALAGMHPLLMTESQAAAAAPASVTQAAPSAQTAQTAQTAQSTPATGASAPSTLTKRPPRGMTSVEASQNAAPPGDLRPENPVVPQISLPIGRNRDATAPSTIPAGSDGIDDDLARCQAQTSRQGRAECRGGIARPAVKPAATAAAPNRPMQGTTR